MITYGGSIQTQPYQCKLQTMSGESAPKLRRERRNSAGAPKIYGGIAQTQPCQLHTMPGGSAPKLRPKRERLNSGHWKDTELKAQVK